MAHLTVIGGAFGGGERAAQSIFEYHVPASASSRPTRTTSRWATCTAGRPCPRPARCVYSGIAVRGRLRRAGQHAGGVPGRGRPDHPGAGHRHPGHRGPAAADGAWAPWRELVARVEEFGDDFLRVYVREPSRAPACGRSVTDALPNALEVRIDPEFAAAVEPGAPTANHAGPLPRRAVRRLLAASVGVADDRVQALFAQLHDRITSTGSRG